MSSTGPGKHKCLFYLHMLMFGTVHLFNKYYEGFCPIYRTKKQFFWGVGNKICVFICQGYQQCTILFAPLSKPTENVAI